MIKNRLKEILEDRGIMQKWLAEKAGIDKSTMGNIIKNRYSTSLEVAFKIARALGLHIEDIWEFKEDEN
jgi:putative transcriptional regulator